MSPNFSHAAAISPTVGHSRPSRNSGQTVMQGALMVQVNMGSLFKVGAALLGGVQWSLYQKLREFNSSSSIEYFFNGTLRVRHQEVSNG